MLRPTQSRKACAVRSEVRGRPNKRSFQYVATLLDHLARQLQADLGRNVVGLYVYGSLTQHAFDVRRSDVDCVAVIRRRVSPVVVSRLRTSFRRLSGRHSWMRRLQLTILIQRELLQFNGDGWLYQFGRLSFQLSVHSQESQARPNKRLKLAGALVLAEAVESCLAATGLRPLLVAPAGE